MATITAREMAKQVDVDPKEFRQALLREEFPWHAPLDRWTVVVGSEKHAAMECVLKKLSN